MMTLFAYALIASAGAGMPQATTPQNSTTTAPAKPPKPICRSENVTGSIFPTRTCHSKEEWVAIDAANAADAERMSSARNSSGRMTR